MNEGFLSSLRGDVADTGDSPSPPSADAPRDDDPRWPSGSVPLPLALLPRRPSPPLPRARIGLSWRLPLPLAVAVGAVARAAGAVPASGE